MIVNKYYSPMLVIFPSITHELYRSCSWLPVFALILPGLLISFLKRFDQSRSTSMYILIGLISYYVGAFLWALVDRATVHSLPFAIILEPTTLLIIGFISHRRN